MRQDGDALAWIYTRKNVQAAFSRISPLFFLALGLMAAGFILGVRDCGLERPVKDEEMERNMLPRLGEIPEDVRKEQRKERLIKDSGIAAFILCMIPVILYLIQSSHFPKDQLEDTFYALLLGILPFTALGVGFLSISSLNCLFSVRRQIEGAKKELSRRKEQALKQGKTRHEKAETVASTGKAAETSGVTPAGTASGETRGNPSGQAGT